MFVDTHVHIWEIDPPRYPVGPTAPGWKSEPDEPATAEELIADMDANGILASMSSSSQYFPMAQRHCPPNRIASRLQ